MSTTENGTLSARDYERVLSSIRSDARKIAEALNRMEEDGKKLHDGGHPAPALVVTETITAMRVCMGHIREVFKVEL